MNPEHICMGCMGIKGDAQYCGDCGWKEGTPADLPLQLQPRTLLDRRYLLGRVLGQGGFGITYLGWDLNLNRKLAVKEYFPREVCGRGKDEETVQPLSQRNREAFQYGLRKFLEEGRALARFQDHPNIVSMLDYFEGNGTAYIVMAYVEGFTLKQYLDERGGRIPFETALNILIFVMDGLREVHKAGMLHRDISPDNIYLDKKHQVKILDFGATRYAMREQVQSLTVLFKPGYAPIEQYSSGGKQGPWTDVYALGATFYRAITGQVPAEAPDRLVHDDLVPPRSLGVTVPEKSEAALLKALAVHGENRFPTVGDFQNALLPKKPEGPIPPPPGPGRTKSIPPWLLVATGLLFLATLGSSAFWYSARGQLKSAKGAIEGLKQQLNQGKHAEDESVQSLMSKNSALTREQDDLRTQLDTANRDRDDLRRQLSAKTTQDRSDKTNFERERENLQAQLASLQAANQALETERDGLKRERDGLNAELSNLRGAQTAPRLSIATIDLYNYDSRKKQLLGGSSISFQADNVRYVLCRVAGPNPLYGTRDLTGVIGVQYIGPDGVVRRGTMGSTAGVTTNLAIAASKSQKVWQAVTAWGDDKRGAFIRGRWRIDFLWDGQKIAGKTFQVQ